MRVFETIRGKAGDVARSTAGRWADHWLAATGGTEDSRDHERALMASAAGVAGVAFVTLAPLSFLMLSPSVALPSAVAASAAAFLVSATAAIGRARALAPAAAERSQMAAEAEFLAASRFCPGLVLVMDGQGQVLATGGRDRDTLLARMADPLGRGFTEQVHVSDRIAYLTALDRLRQGEASARVDVRLEPPLAVRARDGQFAPVRLDFTADWATDGSLSRILCQLTDSSEEALLRSEAQAKTAEAENANELKSRFLAAVSHELRTPLNAILGFSDILLGEYFGKLADDRQREYVGLIRQSGAHLLSVVNTMLDMSKIEAGRYELMMEPFLASEPIRVCEEMLGLQAREKGLTLTSRIQRDIGEVVADRRALSQVLINLVGNAIKFTDRGGVVSIDAVREDGLLTITVSDTGIGIAEDKLDLIGQPFRQIQNAYTRHYEGTGLGLSLVKGLVRLHGGSFSIRSRPGEGTVITVCLPDDGSGAAGAHDEPEGDRPVEFPPRLGTARKAAADTHEGMSHGTPKAQSA
ncbi:sensor histidine kinase [Gellertiella hungarica]|uniref:histidine kinase n=1 Tax=Gellertiella hungarica TaxID=1572859 RepID=A0A7W6NLM7_9HYPH|nr:HAMP domain-containing sensor histidine kinase [Gellertiella hungarica]MBB4065754.1 cell cycle sensor histidine kinase DivJ [Gellertiella hungarica]